ncbi:MAG: class II aldolase/adducin family protein [Chitinivibrionales bacterium]|nr:class II aldolase/adducin family protein [Chitinivibrionales bacterium]
MHAPRRKYDRELTMLAAAAVRVADRGHVTSHGGNLSWRVDDDAVLITPTGMPKGELTTDDVVIVDMQGAVLYAAPGRRPTGETPLHLQLLHCRPDLRALVHAHPPALTGLAMARSDVLTRPYLPEPAIEIGPVVSIPYIEPVSDELGEAFAQAADEANAFLMYNHGVTVGSHVSVTRAVELLEMLEACALSLRTAVSFGGAHALTDGDVRRLDGVRSRRGLPLPGKPGRFRDLCEAFDAAAKATGAQDGHAAA